MKTSTNNTTGRLIMVPVALLVMVLLWLLFNWEVGLLGAGMVVYLAPDLMIIFSKRWRVMRAEAERERRLRKEIRKLDRKAYRRRCLEREEHNSDNPGFIPMS